MLYRYVAAYSLHGIARPNNQLEGFVVDLPAVGVRGVLTGSLESIPVEVDQATAIGHQMLRAFVGQAGDGTPEERVAREVDELRQQRVKEVGEDAILLIDATGEVEDFDLDPQRELSDFAFALCNSPKREIRARYESAVHGLLAALALVSEQLCGIKKIVDQVIFVRNDGKPIFCCSITGSGGAYMSSSIPQDALLTLPLHARSLSQQQGLMSAARLLTRSLAEQSDPLLAFLSVWFGLEIFVEKNFKEYEDRAHKRLTAGEPPVVPAVVAERIRAGNSGKYSLVEKFSVIATELSAPEIEKDQASFESIKKTRNRLLHGEDIPLSALPTTNAQRLLRKYIRLHLQRSR